jgi:hypothetical protein
MPVVTRSQSKAIRERMTRLRPVTVTQKYDEALDYAKFVEIVKKCTCHGAFTYGASPHVRAQVLYNCVLDARSCIKGALQYVITSRERIKYDFIATAHYRFFRLIREMKEREALYHDLVSNLETEFCLNFDNVVNEVKQLTDEILVVLRNNTFKMVYDMYIRSFEFASSETKSTVVEIKNDGWKYSLYL